MHPLVELANKQYYHKSHINEPLVTDTISTKDDAFRTRANDLVSNIKEYPHAFVLACLMDTGVDANIAWSIPCRVLEEIGTFEIEELYKIPREEYISMFNGKSKWHRYPERSAGFFFDAIHKIVENSFMSGDAARIWEGKPSSRDVVLRFMDFNGCGFKVANMAPNLLYRYFGIEFSDYNFIDIAPDVHTMRVFQRMGLTPYIKNIETARIYTICKARELNPEFPGIVDGLCWEVGRNFCNPQKPKCDECPLGGFCEKHVCRGSDLMSL